MSIPTKLHWRWKLLLSSGVPYYSTGNKLMLLPMEKNSNELPKRFFFFYCGETEQCQGFDESQRNSLNSALTIHSLKAKSNASICVEQRLSALTFELQLRLNSLSLRIKAMKGSYFQRKMCFNLTIANMLPSEKKIKVGHSGELSGLFPPFKHPEKAWICTESWLREIHRRAGLFSTVQFSEHSE